MTKLSPVAQVILDAANSWASSYGPDDCLNDARQTAVATLRAIDEELASCLFVGPDEGDIKCVIDLNDLQDLIDELEAQ
jgi:hypothetical protein